MNDYVMIVSLASLPLGVWLLARLFMPRHTWIATGIAFGLVISLLSELLWWFFGLGDQVFFGGICVVSTLFHVAPALVLIDLFEIHTQYWTPVYYFYLPLGVFWAAIYGYIGFRVDRARLARLRSLPRAQ